MADTQTGLTTAPEDDLTTKALNDRLKFVEDGIKQDLVDRQKLRDDEKKITDGLPAKWEERSRLCRGLGKPVNENRPAALKETAQTVGPDTATE